MSMRLAPYLVMEGKAREAVTFYEEALDATLITMQTYGDLPANPEHRLPEAARSIIAHAMLSVGESDLVICDTFPGTPYQQGNHVAVMLTISGVDKTRQTFEALQKDGQVIMPLMETPFSPAFGKVKDKFGVTFQIVAGS